MAKNKTNYNDITMTEIALLVHLHGLRGSRQRVIELLNMTDANFFSFSTTEDGKAMIVVVAKENYYESI
jgi:hypothetical protein